MSAGSLPISFTNQYTIFIMALDLLYNSLICDILIQVIYCIFLIFFFIDAVETSIEILTMCKNHQQIRLAEQEATLYRLEFHPT